MILILAPWSINLYKVYLLYTFNLKFIFHIFPIKDFFYKSLNMCIDTIWAEELKACFALFTGKLPLQTEYDIHDWLC